MSSERIRVNDKTKLFIQRKAQKTGLTEGEIVEIEFFGTLTKKRK